MNRCLRWLSHVVCALTVYRKCLKAHELCHTSAFDVLVIFRVTLGLCLNAYCSSAAAVDIVRGRHRRDTAGSVNILRVRHADGVVRTVDMHDGLLSLGRFIWEQPSRLGGKGSPWDMRGLPVTPSVSIGRPGLRQASSSFASIV